MKNSDLERPAELADFDFDLPPELIASHPPAERGDSRLLIVQPGRTPGEPRLIDSHFRDLPELLRQGDLLIANDSRVSHRRVRLRRLSGARIEALFLRPLPDYRWLCLVRGLKKLRPGEILVPEAPPKSESSPRFRFEASRSGDASGGNAVLTARPPENFAGSGFDLEAFFESQGEVPIPPYLGRAAEDADRERYQTVFARAAGSIAAPTAGLHFTDATLEEIANRGAKLTAVELRIGYGTFAPVDAQQLESRRLHLEEYQLSPETAALLNDRESLRRRIAVGTTALRALEANWRRFNPDSQAHTRAFQAGEYSTDLFLRPPDEVQTIDALLTNFHLPASSLLMLVACVLPRADILAAYQHAVEAEYRFFSYGDAMLLCRPTFLA